MGFLQTRQQSLSTKRAFLALFIATGFCLTLPLEPGSAQMHVTHYTAANFAGSSTDETLQKAFELMETGLAQNSLTIIIEKPAHVTFQNMRKLSPGLANYDALSWLGNAGEYRIYVNEKHRKAPPQALAAMLSHEAMHNDSYNSMTEEIAGWRRESLVWDQMKARYPELSLIPPGKFPLVDRENAIEAQAHMGNLVGMVRGNPGYAGLPETSPGFGDDSPYRNLRLPVANQ